MDRGRYIGRRERLADLYRDTHVLCKCINGINNLYNVSANSPLEARACVLCLPCKRAEAEHISIFRHFLIRGSELRESFARCGECRPHEVAHAYPQCNGGRKCDP